MKTMSLIERDLAAKTTLTADGLQILLIRPGATVLDDQGRIKGDLDLPLSPNGVRQVESLMQNIGVRNVDAIYSSPCVSARQTADALAGRTHSRVRIDEDLRNLDHGLWEGKRFDELKQTQPRIYQMWAEHPENVAPPFGETLEHASERAKHFLKRLFRRTKTGTVAIVAAEPLASIIRSQLVSEPIENFWDAEQRTADWELISVAAEIGVRQQA